MYLITPKDFYQLLFLNMVTMECPLFQNGLFTDVEKMENFIDYLLMKSKVSYNSR